jgi:DsbC/DsbD-like thiol-disulfide interchange protein
MNLYNNKRKMAFGLVMFLTAMSFRASAQILDPVKWSYAARRTGKDEAVVFLKATIEDGWHIYSTRQKDGGPVKTSFTFSPGVDYVLVGTMMEPMPVTKFEKSFGMDVHYFERSVIFQQKVRLKKPQAVIKGKLEFMVCNDQKCLPPDERDFSIAVK